MMETENKAQLKVVMINTKINGMLAKYLGNGKIYFFRLKDEFPVKQYHKGEVIRFSELKKKCVE